MKTGWMLQEEKQLNFKKIAVNKDNVKKKVVEILLPSVNLEKDEFMEKYRKIFYMNI